MNYEDFIRPTENDTTPSEAHEEAPAAPQDETKQELELGVELDVQKAVVESLAADKAEQSVEISTLRREKNKQNSTILALQAEIEKLKAEIDRFADLLAKNEEKEKPNQVTLLERSVLLEDRFESETYDHVIEALKDARDQAEKDGRCRHAQILEAVLTANESTGNLDQQRQDVEKIFADNQNVINGDVINKLDKLNIPYKVGENYLLVGEIIKRVF